MPNLEMLAACILSGQVEAREVVALCEEHPALLALVGAPAEPIAAFTAG